MKGVDYATYDQYRKELTAVQREMQRLTDMFEQAEKQLKGLKKAAAKTPLQPKEIAGQLYTIQKELTALARKAEGVLHEKKLENAIHQVFKHTCARLIVE